MEPSIMYSLTNKVTEESFNVLYVKNDGDFFSFKLKDSAVWLSLPKTEWTLGDRRSARKEKKWDAFGNLV